MKVTAVLLKIHKGFWFKRLWALKGKYVEPPLLVPKPLQTSGIAIIDPTHTTPAREEWRPPVVNDPRFASAAVQQDDPDWHETPVHAYPITCRLWEGVKQAEVLTKCVVMRRNGLPEHVTDAQDVLCLPNQDVLVQRYIFQANLWNPASVKLPPRKKPDDVSVWKFKAEYGIPTSRSASILSESLVRLCFMAAGASPRADSLLRMRKRVEDCNLSVQYSFEGKPVYVTGSAKWAVVANKALPPFVADQVLIDATAAQFLPDLFPMSPLLDLEKRHIYRAHDAVTTMQNCYSHSHMHTFLIQHDNDWTIEQRDANAIIMAFGHCVAEARSLYGSEALGRLPQPVAVQCVHTDGISFGFVCFQLNTLNLASPDGIKNMAWIESGLQLFDKVIPRRSMLRNTSYENYNPAILKKLLALFVNGSDV